MSNQTINDIKSSEEYNLIEEYSMKYPSWRELERAILITTETAKEQRKNILRMEEILHGQESIPIETEISEEIDTILSECKQFIEVFPPITIRNETPTYLPPDFVAHKISLPLEKIKTNISTLKSKTIGLTLAYKDSYELMKNKYFEIIDMLPKLTEEAHKEYLSEEEVRLLEHDVKSEIKIAKSYLLTINPDEIDSLEDVELKNILLKLFEKKYKSIIEEIEILKTKNEGIREENVTLHEDLNECKASIEAIRKNYIKPDRFQDELAKASQHFPTLQRPDEILEFEKDIVFCTWYSTFVKKIHGQVTISKVAELKSFLIMIYKDFRISNADLSRVLQKSKYFSTKVGGVDYTLNDKKLEEIMEIITERKNKKFVFLMRRDEMDKGDIYTKK